MRKNVAIQKGEENKCDTTASRSIDSAKRKREGGRIPTACFPFSVTAKWEIIRSHKSCTPRQMQSNGLKSSLSSLSRRVSFTSNNIPESFYLVAFKSNSSFSVTSITLNRKKKQTSKRHTQAAKKEEIKQEESVWTERKKQFATKPEKRQSARSKMNNGFRIQRFRIISLFVIPRKGDGLPEKSAPLQSSLFIPWNMPRWYLSRLRTMNASSPPIEVPLFDGQRGDVPFRTRVTFRKDSPSPASLQLNSCLPNTKHGEE